MWLKATEKGFNMSQHDFNVANQGFPAFRSDLNSALAALASTSSGTSAPNTTYANQFWYDETNNILKMRDEANANWINLGTLDQVAKTYLPYVNGTAITGMSSQAVAEAGTDNATLMTPLRVAQAIDAQVSTIPSGAVAHFAMNTAPTGWLKANGALVSRTTYAALFSAIGTTFGVGDGSTTFALPDMRGRFTRNWADNGSIDSGRAFGSAQDDALQGHNHEVHETSANIRAWLGGGGGTGSGNVRAGTGTPAAPWADATTIITNGTNGTPRIASETRPSNIALLACIKY